MMARLSHVIPLLTCATALSSSHATPATKRVAIIGAGAGGSSAAYHLAQYAASSSTPTNITVFERSSYIGGRTTTVDAWSDPAVPIELGGSIFVDVNHILVNATRDFNLSIASSEDSLATRLELPDLGIWDGKQFVLVTSEEDGWWDKARLLWRYGLAPLKTNRLMKSAVGRFLGMYEEPVFPWSSLGEALEGQGLLEITGVTGEQYLTANGIGNAFASEVIQASTRVNYASNLAYIHGLETMVCMATSGAMQIDGGNWRIFASMLKSSPAITTHLNTQVSQISKQDDGTYHLSINESTSTFDDVILAAPLQFTNLTISPAPQHAPDTIPYVKLHVTLFASPYKLSPSAFNLSPGENVPQYVLTTLPASEAPLDGNPGTPGFYSISMHYTSLNRRASPPRQEFIYKIFSVEPITSTFLSHVLGHSVSEREAEGEDVDGAVSWVYRKVWHSYPREYPRVTFEEIRLDGSEGEGEGGLWYTSGMESFISTMETSALSGKNVARLIKDKWEREKSGSAFASEEVGQDEVEGAVHHSPPDAQAQAPVQFPALSLPEPESDAPQLEVDGEGVTLDHLGPMVVNKDGSLSRIANWETMSEKERKNTLRVLGKRNQLRLGELKGEQSEL
ncbi:Prenylcysteine oxidase [Macroventuria anomochaeta]|uniref:Prenylcysteine oxidase n=1 Tax=Macroventuria anomochaeta TaxID=301207 RepID=A0ACB6S952_9PLEO|nr:Prenylcysteine oxidase [Macroventuria anomochaeta]KAF2630042.1 Prenylcysteine oxidase [Macroventuria anomochaeta]